MQVQVACCKLEVLVYKKVEKKFYWSVDHWSIRISFCVWLERSIRVCLFLRIGFKARMTMRRAGSEKLTMSSKIIEV